MDLISGRYLAAVPTEAGTHTLAYLPNTDLVYVYRNQSNAVDIVEIDRAGARR